MMQPFTTSPVAHAPRAGRLSWTGASCRPSRCWVRVRSMRNGSTESLDHLQRASKARPRQQQGTPSARRRVIQTTPFGTYSKSSFGVCLQFCVNIIELRVVFGLRMRSLLLLLLLYRT
ncbi:Os05g0296800 [Oryza sativa Japonica Group]|uniref:Os05g0296800 protein n=1 Tax=Oryza sativa subsp. japonica TaxID=39947 RepID=A0A0P0WKH7_ORYSJ|nr:Os05g0296800 [Oryza sativa Japonica Group]